MADDYRSEGCRDNKRADQDRLSGRAGDGCVLPGAASRAADKQAIKSRERELLGVANARLSPRPAICSAHGPGCAGACALAVLLLLFQRLPEHVGPVGAYGREDDAGPA